MKPEQPAPACMCMPSALDVAAGDVGAEGAGRREHAERDGVDAGDGEGAVLVREAHDLGALVFDRAQVAGVLPVHGGHVVAELGPQVGRGRAGRSPARRRPASIATCVGMTSGWQSVRASARRMGLIVRGTSTRGAAGDALGHAEAAPGHVAPVVDGVGHAVQVEQLAELAVELEARLVLAQVGVVAAAVGREELGAVDDLVDDRRHVVLPAAGAAEVEVVLAARVAVEQALDVASQVALGEDRLGNVEPALEAQAVGDLGVDLLDAARARARAAWPPWWPAPRWGCTGG